MLARSLVVAAALSLSACSALDSGGGYGISDYALVRAQPRSVGDGRWW